MLEFNRVSLVSKKVGHKLSCGVLVLLVVIFIPLRLLLLIALNLLIPFLCLSLMMSPVLDRLVASIRVFRHGGEISLQPVRQLLIVLLSLNLRICIICAPSGPAASRLT